LNIEAASVVPTSSQTANRIFKKAPDVSIGGKQLVCEAFNVSDLLAHLSVRAKCVSYQEAPRQVCRMHQLYPYRILLRWDARGRSCHSPFWSGENHSTLVHRFQHRPSQLSSIYLTNSNSLLWVL
jgi:hypothetical protein